MKIKAAIAALLTLLVCAVPVRADETLTSGLTLTIPSQGSRNWGATFKNSFAQKISEHDHTGSGKGLQISTNAIAANAVTAAKLRFANNEYMRARNAANSADIDIIKVNTSNTLTLGATLASPTITGGSWTGGTDLAVADGGTGASTDSGARTNLGLVIGTHVQAYDADLSALAGLTSAANKVPYFTGSGTAAVADFSSFGRSLVDDADAAAGRSTLTAAKSGANTDITSIYAATSDGSDNSAIDLGHADSTRGAGINLFGNEHASQAGILQFRAGAGSTIGFAVGISTTMQYDGSSLSPQTDGGIDLGSSSKYYDEVYANTFKKKNPRDYTVFNTAADLRSIDPTAVGLTVNQVAQIVDTMVQDLIEAGIFE